LPTAKAVGKAGNYELPTARKNYELSITMVLATEHQGLLEILNFEFQNI
jgi:hypothetical protein